jgi:hypothetical protein
MANVEKFSRIVVKRTNDPANPHLVATIPPTNDHTILPKWATTDIYVGEFFLNEIDEKLFIRVNNTTIRQLVFFGDNNSGGTSGTGGTGSSGTSGVDGTSGTSRVGPRGTSGSPGTSGTDGTSGTFTGVTTHNLFYYLSGISTLYVPEIVAYGLTLTGLTTSGSTNYIVTDSIGKLHKTSVIGVTDNVPVAKVGGGTRTLQFENGLYVGYIDS